MKIIKYALVLVLLHCTSVVSAQNPALESWLAGGDPLPALNQPPADSAAVPLRYWQPDSLIRLAREWGYLATQARAAARLLGEQEDLRRMETEAARVVKNCDGGDKNLLGYLPDLHSRLARHRAAINALVTRAPVAAVSWEEAYTRLDPSALPAPASVKDWDVLALRGEHHAVGIVVSNCTAELRQGSVMLSGLDPAQATCQVRQQVFVEDFYLREKRRTADPLPLLKQSDGAWTFDLPPGGAVKLHLHVHVQPGANGVAQAAVQVAVSGAEPTALRLTLRTPPVAAPTTDFQHLAFMYHTVGNAIAGKPEVAADDLAAHGVTMFEFAGTPKAVFDKEGNLLSADFSAHEPYLRAYLLRGLRPMIYWIDALRTADGEALKHPVRSLAYANLLRAFLKRAKELGYGPEHFVIMPGDEPHGGGYDGGEPDEHIRQMAESLKIIKEAVPELPVVTTITYYASPPVVKTVLPYVDVFVPHWPFPEKLDDNRAPNYNPRAAFEKSIMPMMERERAGRNATVMCYTVANGPTHGLLGGNRAFPIIAFGKGFTGVSHWAYNDIKGSTWHPWDGADAVNLDYIFVYDGTESHKFNHAWNPVGEVLVPSIRWEALRAGIQDAHLLTWLKAALEQNRLPGEAVPRARACLDTARSIAEGKTELTDAAVARLSRELREVYVAASPALAAADELVFTVRKFAGEYATNGVSTPFTETIHRIDTSGRNERTVVDFGDAACAAPAFSPAGDWLYFQSNRGGAYHIYRCRPDGAEVSPLTTPERPGAPWKSVFGVQVTSTGQVLGTFHDGDRGCVALLSADGAKQQLVAPHLGYLYMSALSPTGDAVIASGPASNYRLWLLRLPGAFRTGEDRITGPDIDLSPEHPNSYAPQFTPNGKTIVYSRIDGDIYRIDADGTGRKQLTTGNKYVEFRLSPRDKHGSTDGPQLSPAGEEVAYVAMKDGIPNIHIVDIEGRQPRQLTFRKSACGRPRWSPDGKSIAFVSFVGQYPQLFVVSASGGEPRQLTNLDGAVYMLNWRPKGEP